MKKFTLFTLAALLMAVNVMAQPKGKVQTQAKRVSKATQQAKAPERPVLKISETVTTDNGKMRQLPRAAREDMSMKKQKDADKRMQSRKHKAASVAKRRAAGVIIDQPEGTYYNMVYATSYYGYHWLYGLYNGTYTDAFGEVVEGVDGCLYIHNLLTEMATPEGYWIKAEKVEGKADTYVIHEQPIYVEDYYGTLYTYSIMKVVYDASQQTMVPAKNTDITVTWKDGKLRTANEFNNPNSISTTISSYDDSGYWSGAMNWDITMTPQTAKAITELPAGMEAQDVVVKYADGTLDEDNNPNMVGEKVKMAVSGNDIYLQFYSAIDSWIKGTINGDKATFASGQYLGGDSQYGQHVYFVAAQLDEEGHLSAVKEITFDYDASNFKLSNSKLVMLANGGAKEIYYIKLFDNPEFYKFVDVAATPQPVPASSFAGMNYDPYYGMGYMDFTIPNFDVDGNYIDPAKISYKVFVGDDEKNSVFTFEPSEYVELTEAMTEVPYTFTSDNFWVSGATHEFVHYVNKAKNFGIQVIYKGGGETRTSEISWYYDNNGAAGFESVFPSVEDPMVNSELADGEMALNLGLANYTFGSGITTAETYDVAMKVEDSWISGAKLSGKKVSAISVPFLSVEGISNTKVWLSTSIELDADGKFTPNGPVKEFTLSSNGYTTVKLDEPYMIPEDGGLYIGYSFTQAAAESGAVQPVVLTGTTNVGGFMIHTDRAYRLGWASMEGVEGDLALEAVLVGGEANAAEITTMKDAYQLTGKEGASQLTISNYGYKGLTSAAYSYYVLGDGIELSGAGEMKDINIAPVFGGYTKTGFNVPAVSAIGDDVMYANITKANGEDNEIEDSEAQCNVFVMDFLPTKRPLMEEYTGTWCGYCPRGFVGLEKMAELYPEDFVALSYHNGDPMEIADGNYIPYPSDVTGFPAAYLDRVWETDAYHGGYDEDFGIERTWKERCQEFGVADIDVEAQWSEDMKTINIKSSAKFARSEEFANYAISYAVVADGLTGTGSDWAQSNYYADQAMGTPLYMEQFYNGGDHVSGLVFNDVIVATAPYEGVGGSIPETIEQGVAYTHEFSFNADDIVNTSGEPIIQDKSKLKVVAMLVEGGAVVNANKCKVAAAPTAISDLKAGADRVVKTEYFDLSGRKVLVPSNGIYLQSQQLKNGETVTRKVVIK